MSQGFGNAAWTILLPSWIAKTWILLTASKQPPAFHPLQERQRTRLPRHRSFKRTWRPPHHQRIEEAHAQRSILGVRFPPPSISKTRYCSSVISEEKKHLSSVLVSNSYPFSLLQKLTKTGKTKQQCRTRQRVQIYRGFTFCFSSLHYFCNAINKYFAIACYFGDPTNYMPLS